jgi:general secretion pathway protein D
MEAGQLAAVLNMRFPGNPAIQSARTLNSRNDVLADMKALNQLKGDRMLQIQRGIILSSIPETEDITFPKDWVEKSKRRSPAMQLTATERKILKALNTPMSIDFKSEPLQNVIDYLQKQIGEAIIIPREILAEVNAAYDTPITIQSDRASTRSVLKRILADLNLTYVIKDQVIQVTTRERAKDMMTTRVYYIGDLASATGFNMGPFGNQFQAIQNINGIMNLITSTIDPQSWQPNGPATIAFEPGTMSLIIRQSAEVHMMIGVGLR